MMNSRVLNEPVLEMEDGKKLLFNFLKGIEATIEIPTCKNGGEDLGKFFENLSEFKGDMPDLRSLESLAGLFFNEEIWNKYKDLKTPNGVSLLHCLAAGLALEGQHVGIQAGDQESYTEFKDLFDPIIKKYHNIKGDKVEQKIDMDTSKVDLTLNDSAVEKVQSVGIRIGRNIKGYALAAGITSAKRNELEGILTKECFEPLQGEIEGNYTSLSSMTKKLDANDYVELVLDMGYLLVVKNISNKHTECLMFVNRDPALQASGNDGDWAAGRGIYHNDEKTFLVWVNEEDHLRMVSWELVKDKDDVTNVFNRLAHGDNVIELGLIKKGMEYMFDSEYGYIHSCPSNLGTGLTATMAVNLPNMRESVLKDLGKLNGVEVESNGEGLYQLSNKNRLGYTEVELVQNLVQFVNNLSKIDTYISKCSEMIAGPKGIMTCTDVTMTIDGNSTNVEKLPILSIFMDI